MKYSVALIGCGRISFKHVEAFVGNKEVLDLVAVCDPVVQRAGAKKVEYLKSIPDGKVAVYIDYKKMLAECKPDFVTIATPSGIMSL